jgi:hypothetical protein
MHSGIKKYGVPCNHWENHGCRYDVDKCADQLSTESREGNYCPTTKIKFINNNCYIKLLNLICLLIFVSEGHPDHQDYMEPVKTQEHEDIDIGKRKKL